MEKKRQAESTWLIVSEIDGSVVLSCAASQEQAEQQSNALLTAKGSAQAAGSGVVELDHAIRAARIISFFRANQPFEAKRPKADDEEKPPAIPAAYDMLIPFGYDIERDLKAGKQPPAEKVIPFVQRLGIPIVVSKKIEPAAPLKTVAKDERLRKITIAAVAAALCAIALGIVFIFRAMR